MGFPFPERANRDYSNSCRHWELKKDRNDYKMIVNGFFEQLEHNKKYRERIKKERFKIE